MEIFPKHNGHKYSMGNSKRFADFALACPLPPTETPQTIGVPPNYLKCRAINKNDCSYINNQLIVAIIIEMQVYSQ
jgi:hypothetical protein